MIGIIVKTHRVYPVWIHAMQAKGGCLIQVGQHIGTLHIMPYLF